MKIVKKAHGSGGLASKELLDEIFLKSFKSKILHSLNDQGTFILDGSRFSISTDSYVVDPIFFPGGNIGNLSVNGTVNDISVGGAKPLYLSVAFIIEEGFEIDKLKQIVDSMANAAKEAKVEIITGDTKVVQKGGADKIFINTTGIGIIEKDIMIDAKNAKEGDKILINGTIGDHGIAVLSKREGLNFDSDILSDTAPLNDLIEKMLNICNAIHVMRDPTRGGVSTTLNEIAQSSNVEIEINENCLPVKKSVSATCEMLGLDPLYIANEGKVIAFVKEEFAKDVLSVMKQHKYGKDAAIIGEVVKKHRGQVNLNTIIGGKRIIDMLTGDPLPRIC